MANGDDLFSTGPSPAPPDTTTGLQQDSPEDQLNDAINFLSGSGLDQPADPTASDVTEEEFINADDAINFLSGFDNSPQQEEALGTAADSAIGDLNSHKEDGVSDPKPIPPTDSQRQRTRKRLESQQNTLRTADQQITERIRMIKQKSPSEKVVTNPRTGSVKTVYPDSVNKTIKNLEQRQEQIRQRRLQIDDQLVNMQIEDKGYWGIVKDGAKVAGASIKRMATALNAKQRAQLFEDLQRIDSGELKLNLPQKETSRTRQALDFRGHGRIPSPREAQLKAYAMLNEEDRAAFRRNIMKAFTEDAEEIQRQTDKIRQVADNPVAKQMFQAKTPGEAIDFFTNAPLSTVLSVGSQSMAYMVPPIIGGAIGGFATGSPIGAAVGVGIGSGAMDFYATVTDRHIREAMERADMDQTDLIKELQDSGIDTGMADFNTVMYGDDSWMIPQLVKNNKKSKFRDALLETFNDKEFMNDAFNKSLAHGAAVGFFDGIGAFVPAHTVTSALFASASASKLATAARLGSSFIAGMTLDASAGGAGEAVGELLADGEMRPGEITAEFVGEFFGAPIQIVTNVASVAMGRTQKASFQQRYQEHAKSLLTKLRAGEAGVQLETSQHKIERVGKIFEMGDAPRTEAARAAYVNMLNDLQAQDRTYNQQSQLVFNSDQDNVISPDVAKLSLEGYDATQTVEFTEPALAYSKLRYEEALQNNKTKDKPVVFMSGAIGSGKKTMIQTGVINPADAAVVYESPLSNLGAAVENIEKALDSGRSVQINHVERSPIQSFGSMLMALSETELDQSQVPRIVPVEAAADSYIGARETYNALIEKYGDNDNVSFNLIRNEGAPQEATIEEGQPLTTIERGQLKQQLIESFSNLTDQFYEQRMLSGNEVAALQADTRYASEKTGPRDTPASRVARGEGSETQPTNQPQESEQGQLNLVDSEKSSNGQVVVPLSPLLDNVTDATVQQNSIENFRRTFNQTLPDDINLFDKLFEGIDNLVDLKSPKGKGNRTAAVELVRERRSMIDVGQLEASKFRHELRQKHSEEELTALTFILENTDAPKGIENQAAIQDLIDNPTEAMQQTAEEVRGYLNESHELLMQFYGEDLNFIEDYVPHIWDIPDSEMSDVVQWFKTDNPNVKKRFIDTIKRGIEEKGLTPKTTNIADMLSIYDDMKIKTTANIQFVQRLNNMIDEYGNDMVQRADKAPDNYETIKHPVLSRSIAIKVDKDVVYLKENGVGVHPEIADAVKAVLEGKFDNKFTRGVEVLNGNLKKAWLTFSLFHHFALGEVGLSTPEFFIKGSKILGKGTFRSFQALFQPEKVMQKIKNDPEHAWYNIDLAKDALNNGLQLGALSDVQRGVVDETLQSLEDRFGDGPLKKFFHGITKRNEAWDAALWDYLHNTYKLYAYEALVARNLRKFPDIDTRTIKRETAAMVNDTFGGQNWDALLVHPKMQQAMHVMLLSPDWTISTMRQALSPLGIGSIEKSADARSLRRSMGKGFWVRAGIYFYGGANLVNMAITLGKYGEARPLWGNDPGEKTNIEICNYDDGTKKYLRWGKQFRELLEYLEKPDEKLAGKLSPIIQEGFKQLTKKSPSGFPTEFDEQNFYYSLFGAYNDAEGIRMPDRLEHILKMPIPFSIKQQIQQGEVQPLSVIFPISRGLTPYETREYFIDAINDKDMSFATEVAQHAAENNLVPSELFSQSISQIKSDRKYTLRQDYGVRSFEQLPISVQNGYRQWEMKVDIFKQAIENRVAAWDGISPNTIRR